MGLGNRRLPNYTAPRHPAPVASPVPSSTNLSKEEVQEMIDKAVIAHIEEDHKSFLEKLKGTIVP